MWRLHAVTHHCGYNEENGREACKTGVWERGWEGHSHGVPFFKFPRQKRGFENMSAKHDLIIS